MFKRVEKRRRKKEEEEELGLDEEMKQILGIHDTDSEESDSEDGSSGDESRDGIEGFDGLENLGDGSEYAADDAKLEPAEDEDEALDSEDEAPKDLNPRISISKAVQDPIYLDLVDPMVKLCLVCTGKRLKTENLVEVHRSSNAHQRRFTQFKKALEEGKTDPLADAYAFVHEVLRKPALAAAPKPGPSSEATGKSNRALKKEKTMELRKARRLKARERKVKKATLAAKPEASKESGEAIRMKVKKSKATGEPSKEHDTEESRPKKKARTESASKVLSLSNASSPPKKKTKKAKTERQLAVSSDIATSLNPSIQTPSVAATVRTIAKSATDRAKNARTKASVASSLMGKTRTRGLKA